MTDIVARLKHGGLSDVVDVLEYLRPNVLRVRWYRVAYAAITGMQYSIGRDEWIEYVPAYVPAQEAA